MAARKTVNDPIGEVFEAIDALNYREMLQLAGLIGLHMPSEVAAPHVAEAFINAAASWHDDEEPA